MIDEFLKSKIPFERLGHRADGFSMACSHVAKCLDKHSEVQIIETGTARIADNWEGDGQSTLIWDVLAAKFTPRISVLSIDADPQSITTAFNQTKYVDYRGGDSLMVLRNIPNYVLARTYLVYLDSMDWHEEINMDSAFHAMSELAVIYRMLPSGCMIMVDDAHGPTSGKHWMVEWFLGKQSITPVRKHYQFSWIIP